MGGQQWINDKCSCPNGLYFIGSSCGQCPTGTNYVVQTSSCVNICNLPNQVFANGGCICMNGYTLINGECKIVSPNVNSCPTNKYMINGVCKCLPVLF